MTGKVIIQYYNSDREKLDEDDEALNMQEAMIKANQKIEVEGDDKDIVAFTLEYIPCKDMLD